MTEQDVWDIVEAVAKGRGLSDDLLRKLANSVKIEPQKLIDKYRNDASIPAQKVGTTFDGGSTTFDGGSTTFDAGEAESE